MRPTRFVGGNLLYSKSTNWNVNLMQNTLPGTSSIMFDNTARHCGPGQLTQLVIMGEGAVCAREWPASVGRCDGCRYSLTRHRTALWNTELPIPQVNRAKAEKRRPTGSGHRLGNVTLTTLTGGEGIFLVFGEPLASSGKTSITETS